MKNIHRLLFLFKKQILRIKGGGTGVKGRDGSTRHGLIVTVGKIHGYKPSPKDVSERDKMFGVVVASLNRCLYCNVEDPREEDRIIPACNTTDLFMDLQMH